MREKGFHFNLSLNGFLQNLLQDCIHKEEQLLQIKEKSRNFESDGTIQTFASAFVGQLHKLEKELPKLRKSLSKKREQLEDFNTALHRYEEDSLELSVWLEKKEEELSEIKEHYQQNPNLETMHFVNKCQVGIILRLIIYSPDSEFLIFPNTESP